MYEENPFEHNLGNLGSKHQITAGFRNVVSLLFVVFGKSEENRTNVTYLC